MIQLGEIYSKLGNDKTALKYLRESVEYGFKANNKPFLSWSYSDLGLLYQKLQKRDSAIYFSQKAFDYAKEIKSIPQLNKASTVLAWAYDSIAPLKAVAYYKVAASTRDSIFNEEKFIRFQKLSLDEQRRQQEIAAEKEQYNNRLWRYGLMFGVFFMGIIAFILFRNNQHKQTTNHQLQQQKDKIQRTLSELKSTQNQLIQKEKLASLGELTAGIAHEIQNPLNFVNNFSELSVDLANELKDEIKKPEKDWDLIEDLTNDLTQNQEKINLHGKRASSIVKGMLEHSRTSTGERALTDINKLADEYLRLSYHGLRAKNNDLNCDFKTDFDESLPKIEVIPQDLGRVLLNLINNAFWAVKTVEKPLVIVSTEKSEYHIIIKVSDNGTGMTEATKTKIFQPFFTTKPTGEGTGLGLSLAYDIVTKGQGGTIECESVEGVGTTFIIKLPIQNL